MDGLKECRVNPTLLRKLLDFQEGTLGNFHSRCCGVCGSNQEWKLLNTDLVQDVTLAAKRNWPLGLLSSRQEEIREPESRKWLEGKPSCVSKQLLITWGFWCKPVIKSILYVQTIFLNEMDESRIETWVDALRITMMKILYHELTFVSLVYVHMFV